MFFLSRAMLQISISSPKNDVCGIKNILTRWLYHLLEVFIDYMYKSRIKLTSEKREQYKRNFNRGKFAR